MKNIIFLLTTRYGTLEGYIKSKGGIVTFDDSNAYDVAVFPPGENVSPFLYGEVKMKGVVPNFIRDMKENRLFRNMPQSKPKIGIGRGAHLLCVLSGGSLFQKCDGHKSPHQVCDFMTGNVMEVTSLHDQIMILPDDGAMLCAARAASKRECPFFTEHVDLATMELHDGWNDTEVAWIDSSNSLCFQPRPDFDPKEPGIKQTQFLFEGYFNDWIAPKVQENTYKYKEKMGLI